MASTVPVPAAKTTPKKVPTSEPRIVVPKVNLGDATLTTKAKAFATEAKSASVRTVNDPKFQVSAASAMAGTVAFGACGGAVGMVAGGIVGLPFALFTFGLSIPISAAVGGGVGAVAGGAAGGATGGASGFSAYKWRKEIRDFTQSRWSQLKAATQSTKDFVETKVGHFRKIAHQKFLDVKCSVTTGAQHFSAVVKARTFSAAQKAKVVAKNPHAQVTAASAAAGGVAVGVPCGAVGLVGGAVVGFVPAIFTFGLSIPVFAAVGGGAGFCVGSAAGATTAGSIGYGVYAKKAEIRQGSSAVVAYMKKALGRQ